MYIIDLICFDLAFSNFYRTAISKLTANWENITNFILFLLLYFYNMQYDFFCLFYFKICSSKLCWFHVYDYLPLGMIEQLNMLYRHGTGRHKGWKASLALLTYILCLITDLLCNYVNGTVGVLASSRVNILFMTILHALPKPFDRYSIWITKDRNRRRLISGIHPPVYQTVSPVTGMGWRQCWI